MKGRRLPWFPIAIAALIGTIPPPVRAGEEATTRLLVALAPVLDSSDRSCRSLDIGGYTAAGAMGSDKPPGGYLRFRVIYRAPDRFSLLLSDPEDGTPVAFGSGRKMLVYDPVDPAVYYSERGGIRLEMVGTGGQLRFNCTYLLCSSKPSRILLDFTSLLSITSGQQGAAHVAFEEQVVRGKAGIFRLSRRYEDGVNLTLNVDTSKPCPYTATTLAWNGVTMMCLDRLILNAPLGDELFEFPVKERLGRGLPLKEATTDENPAANLRMTEVIGRAYAVRAVVNQMRPPAAPDVPGPGGVDWATVRENDRKYAKALRELVPPSLRAR
jgi:hypothetical protein